MFLVAPSFQSGKQIGEPFLKGKKLYIKVELPNGRVREVRAYDEKEYDRAFPAKKPDPQTSLESLKKARGFMHGNIKILTTKDKEWLRKNVECRFGTDVGWYVVSEQQIPKNEPNDLQIKEMTWEEFLDVRQRGVVINFD